MAKAETRIYVVKSASNVRLIDATSKNQALNFVAKDEYTVEVATAKLVGQLVKEGAAVEVAASPDGASPDTEHMQAQATA